MNLAVLYMETKTISIENININDRLILLQRINMNYDQRYEHQRPQVGDILIVDSEVRRCTQELISGIKECIECPCNHRALNLTNIKGNNIFSCNTRLMTLDGRLII